MPERIERNNGTGDAEKYPVGMGVPGVYGRFGEGPDEEKLPQLSIVPGLIATVLWVALLIWLATLPGGPLHLPEKPPSESATVRRE
jgi:hypothetical protein